MKNLIVFCIVFGMYSVQIPVNGQQVPQQTFMVMSFDTPNTPVLMDEKKVDIYLKNIARDYIRNKSVYSLYEDPNGGRTISKNITKFMRDIGDITAIDIGGVEISPFKFAADYADWGNKKVYKETDRRIRSDIYRDMKRDQRLIIESSLKGCQNQVGCIKALIEKAEQSRVIFMVEEELGEKGLTSRLLKEAEKEALASEAGKGRNENIDEHRYTQAFLDDIYAKSELTITEILRSRKIHSREIKEVATQAAEIIHNQAVMASYIVDVDKRLSGQLENINETTMSTYLVVDALQDLNIKMDHKLDKLVEKDRIEQIQKEFNDLTVTKRLKELQDPTSDIAKLYAGDEKRRQKDIDVLKLAQVQIVMKKANEYGLVAVEALSTFCKDCPPELSKGIQMGMAVTNIAGSVMSGNYAQAVLGGIGLFKKPQPSPEMQMLKQIQKQIGHLEQNMDAQFKDVHESLLSTERHLTEKLDQIDLKLDGVHEHMDSFKRSMDVQLGTINSQLNFIVGQNKCIQEAIQKTAADNFQVCSGVVDQWNKKLSTKQITSLSDAKDFVDGTPSCKPCIERLNASLGKRIYNDIQFRLLQCPSLSANSYLLPEEMFRYVYESIFQPEAKRPTKTSLQSLLYIPKDVQIAPVLKDSLRRYLRNPQFELVTEDRFYRNYREVILFSDYFLSLFPLLELYDQSKNTLYTPDEIKLRPGLSKSRLSDLKSGLKDLLVLTDHTIMQQNLLSGNGLFRNVDDILSKYIIEKEGFFSIKDAFQYNPYLNKNYSYYYLISNFDYSELRAISKALWNSPVGSKKSVNNLNYLKTEFLKDDQNRIQFQVFLKKQGSTEYMSSPVFSSTLPVVNGELNKSFFESSLEFVTPPSIQELYNNRERLVAKLAEIELVTSPDLDKLNSSFSRKDLKNVVFTLVRADN